MPAAANHQEPSSRKGGRSRKAGGASSDILGASFPPAAGASAWGVNLKTPRYTLLREGPSPLEKLFISDISTDQVLTTKRHRKHHRGGGGPFSGGGPTGGSNPTAAVAVSTDPDQSKITSRVSPGAPYYSTSFAVTPKITDVNVWTLHEAENVIVMPVLESPADLHNVPLPHNAVSHALPPKGGWHSPSPTPAPIVSLPPPPSPYPPPVGEMPAAFAAFVVQPYVLPVSPSLGAVDATPRPKAEKQPPPVWDSAKTSLRPTPFAAPDRVAVSRLRRRGLKRSSVSSQSTSSPLSSQRRAVQVRRRPPRRLTPPKDTDTASSASGQSILRSSRRDGAKRSSQDEVRSVHFADELSFRQKVPGKKYRFPLPHPDHPPLTHAQRRVGCTGC